METKNIAKAIIAVMKSVKGIEKNLEVGKGTGSSYKGVADKDVKKIVGKAMEDNGLCILPINVEAKAHIDRWEETVQYGNNPPQTKQKQSVFTEVKTKYLLLHESGESLEIEGYGHGVDSQDKSAGKATTYALKYALLYAFMVPTGDIDDADKHASDEYEAPKPVAVNSEESIIKMLASRKTKTAIIDLYNSYKNVVDGSDKLKAAFKARQTELDNQQKAA